MADPMSPRSFDITPQGRIVAVRTAAESQAGSPGPAQIQIVLNWFEELAARVPTK